jgi:hypothetical protein
VAAAVAVTSPQGCCPPRWILHSSRQQLRRFGRERRSGRLRRCRRQGGGPGCALLAVANRWGAIKSAPTQRRPTLLYLCNRSMSPALEEVRVLAPGTMPPPTRPPPHAHHHTTIMTGPGASGWILRAVWWQYGALAQHLHAHCHQRTCPARLGAPPAPRMRTQLSQRLPVRSGDATQPHHPADPARRRPAGRCWRRQPPQPGSVAPVLAAGAARARPRGGWLDGCPRADRYATPGAPTPAAAAVAGWPRTALRSGQPARARGGACRRAGGGRGHEPLGAAQPPAAG